MAPPDHVPGHSEEPTPIGADTAPALLRPAPFGDDLARRRFRRGTVRPRAVAWLGVRSFYGHLWHLAASAIATQDIDSRDWMHADDPAALTTAVARIIDSDAAAGSSVTEAISRDLFIDYVADTGDDCEVSRAVAELVARPYELPSPDGKGSVLVPRGDLLLFGGDTAYPVATSTEIESRLLTPWNQVLASRHDGKQRALLGIPGNHDWFDGLDGFARMFRAREFRLEEDRLSTAPGAERPVRHLVSWIEAFAMGKHLVKRRALPLIGYEPVQRASYFAISLAPGLDLWGVDRQLRQVNFQQRRFFWQRRSAQPSVSLLLCLPDPVREYLKPGRAGTATLRALGLSLMHEPILCLAGDVHHYERWHLGPSVHVIAGGGGAFLHGARSARHQGMDLPVREFPGPRASRALLFTVPWWVASGGAGLIPHVALAILFAPALGLGLRFGPNAMGMASEGAAALCALVCSMLGGWRKGRLTAVVVLSGLTGLGVGAVPLLTREAFQLALGWVGASPSPKVGALVIFALAIVSGAWVFGCYLAALAWLGLNDEQAFAALGHPGYRHFVRLRIRKDGSAVDGWVVGLVDPLGDSTPVLVDSFTFRPDRDAVRHAPSSRVSRM